MYFIRKCTTYCERCNKERKNDVSREHIISHNHTFRHGEKFCDICKMNYTIGVNGAYSSEHERKHQESDSHMKNHERLGFDSTYFYKFTFAIS